jgi:hypothetical protein
MHATGQAEGGAKNIKHEQLHLGGSATAFWPETNSPIYLLDDDFVGS